ncbi:hypothetical protein D3C83_37720 [compost metagenome]
MSRARRSVAAGVAAMSVILWSGWNAVKCTGTPGPSSFMIHFDSASISSLESFLPGMRSVVISNHTPVSCLR